MSDTSWQFIASGLGKMVAGNQEMITAGKDQEWRLNTSADALIASDFTDIELCKMLAMAMDSIAELTNAMKKLTEAAKEFTAEMDQA